MIQSLAIMSAPRHPAVEECPIARTSALIAKKWVMLIVRDLSESPRRFSELQNSLHVNPRTLSERLSCLEREGVINRKAYHQVPPRVEYTLTDKGLALLPVMEAMRAYGQAWL